MSEHELKNLVWEVASKAASSGPGYAQEGVVVRHIQERLRERGTRSDLEVQQQILDAWHDLFAEKRLGWGYNLDNPNAPFFHVR
jgi:hypothetical protein